MTIRISALQATTARPDDYPSSVIRDQVGPSVEQVRPYKKPKSNVFPAISGLLDTMVQPPLGHPDPDVVRALATCAGYAYSDVGTVATMMTRLGLERSRCREITRSVDAMLIRSTAHIIQSEDGRVVILCYRGTPPLDLISWLLDADVVPEQVRLQANSQSFEVHGGFYRNVRMTRSEVVSALLRALKGLPVDGDPGPPEADDPTFTRFENKSASQASAGMGPMEALYIAGHSLGGAMAVIMARMLLMKNHAEYREIAAKLRAVYTFGQPMVATPGSATDSESLFDQAKVPLLRYVYRKDPVPALPPHEAGSYGHFGKEYRLAKDGGYRETQSTEQMNHSVDLLKSGIPFVLDKLPGLRRLPWPFDIEDHLPHHYVASFIPDGGTDEFGDYVVARV